MTRGTTRRLPPGPPTTSPHSTVASVTTTQPVGGMNHTNPDAHQERRLTLTASAKQD
jgi:hypothetical protein